MAEVEPYERSDFGSEFKQGTLMTNFEKLIEEEGVFVKEHYRETDKDTGIETGTIWNIYYIPSKDTFVTATSATRDRCAWVTVIGIELMIEECRKILNLNTTKTE